MSETAQTLIKAALRSIGAIAPGETPTSDELAGGLESLKFMLRHWSNKNIRLYCITQDTVTLNSSEYYTIGVGGTVNTARPEDIKGGFVRDCYAFDSPLQIIDESRYRSLSLKGIAGTAEFLWYNPDFPYGKLYFWPRGSGEAYIDSLKPFSEPSLISSSIQFPPGYDEAIKWNLALRLCPEYGKEPSTLVASLALSSLNDIESKNFNAQINAVNLNEELKDSKTFNINEG
jgi:hypothetical protein